MWNSLIQVEKGVCRDFCQKPPFGITAGDANGFYPTGDPQFDEYRLQDRGSFRAIELRRFFAAQAVEYAMANVILGEN